jgi:hypothetical protein
LDWIAPLKPRTIGKLLADRIIQPELFDQRGFLEFEHPDFPSQRFAARRDEKLRGLRARERRSLLGATSRGLARLQVLAGRGSVAGITEIGARAAAIVGKHKTAKFFALNIEERCFSFRVAEEAEAADAALDGISVLRTSLSAESLSAEDVFAGYESLGRTMRAFHSMKTMDLGARPNRRRPEEDAPRDFFLRMLACRVERHMRRA